MRKNWLYYISPCALAAVLCLIAIIQGFVHIQSTGGFSLISVVICIPALFILFFIDIVVKMITKGKLLYIWIVEIIAIVLLVIGFNSYYS